MKKFDDLTAKEKNKLEALAKEMGYTELLKSAKPIAGYEIPSTEKFTLRDSAKYVGIKETSFRNTITRARKKGILGEDDYNRILLTDLTEEVKSNGVDVLYNPINTSVCYGTDDHEKIILQGRDRVVTLPSEALVKSIFFIGSKTPLADKLVQVLGKKSKKENTLDTTRKSYQDRLVEEDAKETGIKVEEEDVYEKLAKAEEAIKILKQEPNKERLDMLEVNSKLQLIVAYLMNPKYKEAQSELLELASGVCKSIGVSVGGN